MLESVKEQSKPQLAASPYTMPSQPVPGSERKPKRSAADYEFKELR